MTMDVLIGHGLKRHNKEIKEIVVDYMRAASKIRKNYID